MEIENFLGLVYGIETYVRRVPFGAQTRCFSAVGFEASRKEMQILNTTSHRPKFSCPLMTDMHYASKILSHCA